MPLITEKVKKNAEACMECAIKQIYERDPDIHKHNVLYTEATALYRVAVNALIRVSCGVCPKSEDFEKVYGVTPREHFQPRKVTDA